MRSRRHLVANMQQASAWVGQLVREGEEIIITALPLYHIFSLTANGLVFMKIGALNYLITTPRDIPDLVTKFSKLQFNTKTCAEPSFTRILTHPAYKQIHFTYSTLTPSGSKR